MKIYRVSVSKRTEVVGYFRHYFTTELGLSNRETVQELVADFRTRFPAPQFLVTCLSNNGFMEEENI